MAKILKTKLVGAENLLPKMCEVWDKIVQMRVEELLPPYFFSGINTKRIILSPLTYAFAVAFNLAELICFSESR